MVTQTVRTREGLADRYAALAGLSRPLRRRRRKRITVSAGPAFSLIDAPDESLACIEAMVHAILSRPKELWFDQSMCTHVDYCATAVVVALVKDAKRQYRVRCGGDRPADDEADELVVATGLPAALKIDTGRPVADFLQFPLRQGNRRAKNATAPSDRNRFSGDLTAYINECLARFGFELTDDQADYLSALTAEVIDNAEQHSQSPRWWMGGYFRSRPGATTGDCHLVIFNVGLSIAESLQRLPQDAALRAGIEQLVDQHRAKWFHVDRGWTEDDLWTLYAMQQGVSAKNVQRVGEPTGDRGQGTVQMIRMFQELGESKQPEAEPLMALISGSTYLRFDTVYKMERLKDRGGVDREMITFNKQRSLDYPPDKANVRHLRHYFPGTLLSVRFVLDRDRLEALHDGR
jgi:hypothetical protein